MQSNDWLSISKINRPSLMRLFYKGTNGSAGSSGRIFIKLNLQGSHQPLLALNLGFDYSVPSRLYQRLNSTRVLLKGK